MAVLCNSMMLSPGRLPPSPWATWNGSLDGSVAVFRSTTSVNTCVAMLTSTSAIVTWEDAGVSDFGFACACTISGVTITWGTPVAFSNGSTISNNSVIGLSSSEAIVCYRDTGDSNKCKAVTLDVSGTTITVNSIVTVEANPIDAISVAKLTSGKAIAVYNRTGVGGGGRAIILDIASGIITPNTAFIFNGTAASSTNCVVSAISSTQAITVYSDANNSSFGTAQVLSVSSSTVSGNTAMVFNSSASSLFEIAALSSSKFGIVFKNAGDSNFSNVQVLSVSGTTISNGSPVRLINLIPSAGFIAITSPDSQTLFMSYRNVTTSRGVAVTGTVSGTVVNLNASVALTGTHTAQDMFVAALSINQIICSYRDQSNSNAGTGIIASVV